MDEDPPNELLDSLVFSNNVIIDRLQYPMLLRKYWDMYKNVE